MTTPYLTTASGQRYRLVGPELDTPRIADIAHHLAQINRFTGAASRPYSVAEHSLLCERIAASEGAGPMARLCALMHDAHEAYTSDMASPAKVAMRDIESQNRIGKDIRSNYDEFENLHHWHVLEAFKLNHASIAYASDIRRWDLIALATERWALMSHADGDSWACLEGVGMFKHYDFRRAQIHPWDHWRDEFLEKFTDLRLMVENFVP